MSKRVTAGAAAAFLLLLGSTMAADALKSGPQPGDTVPGPFNPLNVTGEDAGKKRCQV
jgi:hypothetical protein